MKRTSKKILVLLLALLQIIGLYPRLQTVHADAPQFVLQNNWQPIYPANGQFDTVSDQQTGAHTKEWSQDIVGNAQFQSTYYQFSTDKTMLAIRIRVNTFDGTADSPEFKNFAFAGVDSNGDGAIDFFLGIYNPTGNNGRLGIYQSDPSAANTGPSSTGISVKPLMAFKPVYAANDLNGNYSITPADSNFNASDNTGTGGLQDYYISFSFKLSDINTAIHGLGKTFTADTPFSFITGTASQDNSFNQDISGMDSTGWKSGKTWLSLGALSPLVSANGVIRHTVTFDKNYGDTDPLPLTVVVPDKGTVGSLPSSPTKRGVYFQQWNTAPDGTGSVFTDSTSVASDMTVYAVWGSTQPVQVTFDANTGSFPGGAASVAVTTFNGLVGNHDPGAPTPAVGSKNPYFIGWATTSSASAPDYDPLAIINAPVTYYAVWTNSQGSVLTFYNNKSPDDTSIYLRAYANNGGQFGKTTFPASLSRGGYAFQSWNTKSDGSGTSYAAFPTKQNGVSALYAIWQSASNTVTYNPNGGTLGEGAPSTVTILNGKFGTLPVPPTRPGYHFIEWNRASEGTGEPMNPASDILDNTTVYAIWGRSGSVTLHANGGSFDDGAATTTVTTTPSIIGSSKGKVFMDNFPQPPVKSGYSFGGWSTTSNGSIAIDLKGDMSGISTLYAVWMPIYQVLFDKNAGFAQFITSIPTAYGGVLYLPDAPVRNKYDFVGWNTQINGGGASLSTQSDVNDSMTVYAQWQLAPGSVQPGDVTKPVVQSVTDTSITVQTIANLATGQSVEYAISQDTLGATLSRWQSSPTFVNLQSGTTYYIYARSAEDATHPAGNTQISDPIIAASDAVFTTSITVQQVNGNSPLTGPLPNPSADQSGASVNLPDANAGLRPGFSFAGWQVTGGGVSITNAAQATGASFTMGNADVAIQANYSANALTFNDNTLSGTVGMPFAKNVTEATYGSGNYTYTLKSGTLPNGITFNNGAIAGTPTAAGNSQVVLTATDNVTGAAKDATYTLSIVLQDSLVVHIQDITYGETPSPTAANVDNGEQVTFMYKRSGDDDSMYSAAVPTNAGAYTVLATASVGNITRKATTDFKINKPEFRKYCALKT
ncbi:InlB B-repeat-containing protein [Paenibacillus chartarius]|uniref:InlB B-repeat-containing protein n=1 Tax=Paenibacillus chartarius TaxID=747481 RepID=A0ABV6DLN5_9BACL